MNATAALVLDLRPEQNASAGRTPDEGRLVDTEDGLLFVMEDLAREVGTIDDILDPTVSDTYDFELPHLHDLRSDLEREIDGHRCELARVEVRRRQATEDRHRRIIADARRARGLVCDPEDVVLLGETL